MNQNNTITLPIYQVDAFTKNVFHGNPAAICMMNEELPDHILQSIAAENNLAETAYVWKRQNDYQIRWCTPTIEVDLCGHATLAAAYILFELLKESRTTISFHSRSGILKVTRLEDGMLILDFPVDVLNTTSIPDGLGQHLGTDIIHCIKGKTDYLVEVRSE